MRYLEESFKQAYVPPEQQKEIAYFRRHYDNLEMYSVLKAGHVVPADVPQAAYVLLESMLRFHDTAWVPPVG